PAESRNNLAAHNTIDLTVWRYHVRPVTRRASVCLGLCLLFAARAQAHPVPFSYLDLRLQHDALDVSIVVHVFDAGHDLNVTPAERLLDPGTLHDYTSALEALLAPRLVIAADGHTLIPAWRGVEAMVERQSIRLHATYTLPPGTTSPGTVSIAARMFPYDPQHQTFLNVYDGDGTLTQAILDARHDQFEYFAGTRQGILAVIAKMLP